MLDNLNIFREIVIKCQIFNFRVKLIGFEKWLSNRIDYLSLSPEELFPIKRIYFLFHFLVQRCSECEIECQS